jgi:hypothetical protein
MALSDSVLELAETPNACEPLVLGHRGGRILVDDFG